MYGVVNQSALIFVNKYGSKPIKYDENVKLKKLSKQYNMYVDGNASSRLFRKKSSNFYCV